MNDSTDERSVVTVLNRTDPGTLISRKAHGEPSTLVDRAVQLHVSKRGSDSVSKIIEQLHLKRSPLHPTFCATFSLSLLSELAVIGYLSSASQLFLPSPPSFFQTIHGSLAEKTFSPSQNTPSFFEI